MAKKRGHKKSEVETKSQEEEPKNMENGENEDVAEETPKKKKKISKSSKADIVASSSKSAIKSKEKAVVEDAKSNDSDEPGENDYEVEKILDVKRKSNGKREFLVKWKNYSSEHDSWEPEENLACDELISKFMEIHEKAKNNSKAKGKDDDADYEVLKILDVNYKSNNKKEFLIRWKNYSSKHDTWEPEENLACDELIATFLANEEKRAKMPRNSLREKPKKVAKYESPGNKRVSKRLASGGRKNYVEDDGDE